MKKQSSYITYTHTQTLDLETDVMLCEATNPIEYHRTLPNYKKSPLIELKQLAKTYEVGNLYIKDESSRFGLNAFKALGASYAVHQLIKEKDTTIFCSASAGNHGEAIAKYAKYYGKKAVIYVPKSTKTEVIKRIAQHTDQVIKLNLNYEECCEYALQMSQINDWSLVQDTAWEDYERIPSLIMTGYLTQMYELEEQMNLGEIDILFLQIGVGSWAASVVWYFLQHYPNALPKIVLVEPCESHGMFTSLKEDKIQKPNNSFKTIMDGLNCGKPSLLAFNILKQTTHSSLLIEDTLTLESIEILGKHNIKSGPSGAAGFAGFLSIMKHDCYKDLRISLGINKHTKILFFNTEGPISI